MSLRTNVEDHKIGSLYVFMSFLEDIVTLVGSVSHEGEYDEATRHTQLPLQLDSVSRFVSTEQIMEAPEEEYNFVFEITRGGLTERQILQHEYRTVYIRAKSKGLTITECTVEGVRYIKCNLQGEGITRFGGPNSDTDVMQITDLAKLQECVVAFLIPNMRVLSLVVSAAQVLGSLLEVNLETVPKYGTCVRLVNTAVPDGPVVHFRLNKKDQLLLLVNNEEEKVFDLPPLSDAHTEDNICLFEHPWNEVHGEPSQKSTRLPALLPLTESAMAYIISSAGIPGLPAEFTQATFQDTMNRFLSESRKAAAVDQTTFSARSGGMGRAG